MTNEVPRLENFHGPLIQYVTCRSGCGLRFPLTANCSQDNCPRCRGPVDVTGYRANNMPPPEDEKARMTSLQLSVLVDNVRSLFNVGSIFRCADGASLKHVYLCGISATPEHPRLRKTALGAESSVPWSYHPDATTLARKFAKKGATIWALDTDGDGDLLYEVAPACVEMPIVLVVGNEMVGVDPLLRTYCERAIRIPMAGQKGSLNVAIALGIAAYWLQGQSYAAG